MDERPQDWKHHHHTSEAVNTEWQQNESVRGCVGNGNTPLFLLRGASGSTRQQTTALASVLAFFRGNVGNTADANFNKNFNPQYDLPSVVTKVTNIERGFTPAPDTANTEVFDDFNPVRGSDPNGVSNFAGHPDVTFTYGSIPDHDPSLRAVRISWTSAGSDRFFQSNWTPAGQGMNISSYQFLEFRASRFLNNVLNPSSRTNFSIRLIMADGNSSGNVRMCNYGSLRGPVGGHRLVCMARDSQGNCTNWDWVEAYHRVLQTIRVPLSAFASADLTNVRGIRLVFDGTTSGDVYVANIRFSK